MSKQKQEIVGFFKQGGKTRPITRSSGTASKRIVKMSREDFEDRFSGGKNSKLDLSLTFDDGSKLEIKAPIKWETMKADRLVKTEYRTAGGDLVKKKYIGGPPKGSPKKRLAFVGPDGKEIDKKDVMLVQVNPDGSLKEIEPFEATKIIKAEARDKDLMSKFLPDSYLEIWSDDLKGQEELRKLAFHLMQHGKVAAVSKFAKAKGTKGYVGFLYPVLGDDDTFGLEMMVSENRRQRRRWMPSEHLEIDESGLGDNEADVPDLFG